MMKKTLIKIILSSALFVIALILQAFNVVFALMLAIYIVSYLLVGGDVLLLAAKNIVKRKLVDENLLMSVATLGAFALLEFPEAVAVMLFYQVGELFYTYAYNKSERSIGALMDLKADFARVQRNNSFVEVEPQLVDVGELISIHAGERIPLDGVVEQGSCMMDTSALTGEPRARSVQAGDAVLSGCVNLDGKLLVRVSSVLENSTAAKVIKLTENAAKKKSRAEKFVTRFARVYTPIVMVAAVLLCAIPSIIFGDFSTWLYRALTFLVVSCPCALVVSIPLSFFAGMGGASRCGVLIKGGDFIEALAAAKVAVFDKTGTLTQGVFLVKEINAVGMSERELLELAAHAEHFSSHPIAHSLKKAYESEIDAQRIGEFNDQAGLGVTAMVDGKSVAVGGARLMSKLNIDVQNERAAVFVAVDGVFAGHIVIDDRIKEDAVRAIRELNQSGVRSLILTGDGNSAAEAVAKELGIEVHSELLPAQKLELLERLLEQNEGKVIYTGDGINDAPCLARASVGIAMGGVGTDAAIEAADAVIMTDEPSKVALARRSAKKTVRIARQNIVLTISVKVVVLVLGAFSIASMWMAVFADVGMAVLAVLNAFRALRLPKK